jgi:hypothetical protein
VFAFFIEFKRDKDRNIFNMRSAQGTEEKEEMREITHGKDDREAAEEVEKLNTEVLSCLNIEESYDIREAMGKIFHDRAELERYIHLLEELSSEENPIRHVLDSLKPEKVVVLKKQYRDIIKKKMLKKTEKAKRRDEKEGGTVEMRKSSTKISEKLVSKPNKFSQGSMSCFDLVLSCARISTHSTSRRIRKES